jgi:predicted permease
MIFFQIVLTIIFPIFILLAIGFVLDRTVTIDVQTLTRVSFYVFTPGLIFVLIYESDLRLDEIIGIGAFTVTHILVVFIAALVVFSLPRFRERRSLLALGSVYTNAANYGFPLMLLAFGERAVSVISILLTVQTLLFFTLGLLFLVGGQGRKLGDSLRQVLQFPAIYAIVLGFAMRALNLDLPGPLQPPLQYIREGFLALALITLGVQLSKSPIRGNAFSISMVGVMRFLVAPASAALLVGFFGLDQEIRSALILASGLPTAVNLYIAANEVKREPELASRIVFWTTMISAIAIPIILILIRQG